MNNLIILKFTGRERKRDSRLRSKWEKQSKLCLHSCWCLQSELEEMRNGKKTFAFNFGTLLNKETEIFSLSFLKVNERSNSNFFTFPFAYRAYMCIKEVNDDLKISFSFSLHLSASSHVTHTRDSTIFDFIIWLFIHKHTVKCLKKAMWCEKGEKNGEKGMKMSGIAQLRTSLFSPYLRCSLCFSVQFQMHYQTLLARARLST